MRRFNILFTLFLAPLLGFAGGGQIGNGGYALVCRDSDKKVVEAQTLDLFEGKELWHKTYDTKGLRVFSKLSAFPGFRDTLKELISDTDKIVKFVSSEFELLPTQDAFPVILKKGCQYEQLANYTDDGDLLVSSEIFDKLSKLDKLAFLIHESVYAIFRQLGATDSRDARRLTAELLATNSDQNTIDYIVQNWLNKKIEAKITSEQVVLSCSVTNVLYYLDSPIQISISVDLNKKEMSVSGREVSCVGGDIIGKLQVTPNSYVGSFQCRTEEKSVVTVDRVSGAVRMPGRTPPQALEGADEVGFCKAVETKF